MRVGHPGDVVEADRIEANPGGRIEATADPAQSTLIRPITLAYDLRVAGLWLHVAHRHVSDEQRVAIHVLHYAEEDMRVERQTLLFHLVLDRRGL